VSKTTPITNATPPQEPPKPSCCCSCNCPKLTYGVLYSFSKYLKDTIIPLPHALAKETRSITNLLRFTNFVDISKEWSLFATFTKITSTLSVPGLLCNMNDSLLSAVASGKKMSQRAYSLLKAACALDKAVDGIASTMQILNKLNFIGSDSLIWIPYFKCIDFLNLIAELVFASEITHNVRMFNRALSDIDDLSTKTPEEKEKIVLDAFNALKKLDLKKDLMIEKSRVEIDKERVNLRERIAKVRAALVSKEIKKKTKKEELAKGEKILQGLKGRVRTVLTRNCLNVANRVAIVVAGAFVTFPQLVFPLAVPILFPVGFAIFSCVGIVALALWGHKMFLISKDPFNEKSSIPAQEAVNSLQRSLSSAKESCKEALVKVKETSIVQRIFFSQTTATTET